MKLKSYLAEAADPPKVLLVQKPIWLNFEADDATPIGWQTKQGLRPHTARGLMKGDVLLGPYHHHMLRGYSNYRTVVDQSGEVIKLSPEFDKGEVAKLTAAGIFKVLVK